MTTTPIQTPAGFVPTFAAAFADANGNARLIGASAPLPTCDVPMATTPLSGSTTASGVVGPFSPVIGRPVLLALSGNWTGIVTVMRSTDGGGSKLPLTLGGAPWAVFSVNCCEAVWDESEAAAQLYLNIVLTSGTLTYRIAQ